jgi:hypothetical protein
MTYTWRVKTGVPNPFRLPQDLHTEDARIRRVGFEFEYAGVGLEGVAAAVASLFGGTPRWENRYMLKVEGTRFGDFEIELDIGLLKSRAYAPLLQKIGFDPAGQTMDSLEEFLLNTASTVVPFEVITPPLPMTEMEAVERLREELRLLKARGTRESLIYAFGLHINPEIPSTSVETILSLLRAFLLLEPWIRSLSAIDLSRRLSPFIKEYSPGYRRLIIDPAYGPDLDRFIDDFMEHNPSRNRSLDLLPLLSHLRRDKVMGLTRQERAIKPRPALHYRLPNCLIDDPGWTVAQEWNRWVVVEDLAADRERLLGLCGQYMIIDRPLLGPSKEEWIRRIVEWLEIADR